MIRYSFLLISILLFSTLSKRSLAQISIKENKIRTAIPVVEKVIKEYAEKYHLPGFVYGIVADGELIYSGSDGYINLDQKIPASSQSVFRIASMTKSFVGAAILKLRDEGKIKLDDPAHLYIKELKNQKYLSSDAPAITIRNLLTHTAGFPEDNPWGDRQLDIPEQEFLSMIKKRISFSTATGSSYEYSNMGYAMLGYIIEKVSSKPYEQYISDNILSPLGMNNTYWEYSKVSEKQLAIGYRWENGEFKQQPMLHHGVYGSMGGMLTSLNDFAKYVSFHLSAWPARNGKESQVLKRSSLREMQLPSAFSNLNSNYKYATGKTCPLVTSYGYGLRWSKDCEGRVFIGHSGGLPGFGSNWFILPDYGIGVIFFANRTYAPGTSVNMNVADTLLAVTKLGPDKKIVSSILNERKKQLVSLLPHWNEAKESGLFAENFFLDNELNLLKKESEEIFLRAGKILTVGEVVPENNLRGTFTINCENADIEVYFTLNPENPPIIQDYSIKEIRKNK